MTRQVINVAVGSGNMNMHSWSPTMMELMESRFVPESTTFPFPSVEPLNKEGGALVTRGSTALWY